MVLVILEVNENQSPNVSMPVSIRVDSQMAYWCRPIFFYFVHAFDIMTHYYCSLEALTEPKSKLLVDAGPQLHSCLPNLQPQDWMY